MFLILNNSFVRVHSGLVVSMLDCQLGGHLFKLISLQGLIYDPLVPLSLLSTRPQWGYIYCRREDEPAMKRTGHPPSCAEAEKIKSLTLHILD